MSARGLTAPLRARISPALPVLAGIGALFLRLWILRTPDATRTLLLVLVYGAILAASIAVPVGRMAGDRSRLHPWTVVALGLAGVAIAAAAGRRPVPASFGAAAVALSVFAAVAEEALFRRAAYGWLASHGGAVVAIGGSALLFALIHVPLYGAAAFPVDLGAGLLLSWQRWASGTWTVPAATHAAANLLAVVLR
ncbi:MAG: CPBP family intramembrane glutamic endopeptidase [Actinomycetota bacterium]